MALAEMPAGVRAEFEDEIRTSVESADVADAPEQGTLIPDQSEMSREEVLELVFTPRQLISGQRVIEEISRVGRETTASIAPTAAFVAPQMRPTYDFEHFSGLGYSIRDGFGGQLQRGLVGVHDEENVEEYLDDLNEHFGSKIRPDDLEWYEKFGGYIITIAGHNRQFGIAYVNLLDNGHPDHGIPYQVRVFRNPKFHQAIEAQAAENTGQNLKPWVRAMEMHTLYNQSLRREQPRTIEQVARIFKANVRTVEEAFKFMELPDGIKKLVAEDQISYSGAVDIHRLLKYYDDKDIVDIAKTFARKKLSSSNIAEEVKARENSEELSDDIKIMVESGMVKSWDVKIFARMKGSGVPDELITELAMAITMLQLPREKVLEIAEAHIKAAIDGSRDIFIDDDGLSEEERQAILDDRKIKARNAGIAEAGKIMGKHLFSMTSVLELGLVGKAVEDRPIGSAVINNMLDVIDTWIALAKAESNEDAASQFERRRAEILKVKKKNNGIIEESMF